MAENTVIKERLSKLRAKVAEYGIDYYMIPTSDFHSSELSLTGEVQILNR